MDKCVSEHNCAANMIIKAVRLQPFTQYNSAPHFWPQLEELSKSENTQGDTNNKMIISSALHTLNHEGTCGNLYHAACSYLPKSTLCNYCAIKPLRQCNDWLRCWHGAGSVTQSPRLILHRNCSVSPSPPEFTLKWIFWFDKVEKAKYNISLSKLELEPLWWSANLFFFFFFLNEETSLLNSVSPLKVPSNVPPDLTHMS